MHINMRTNTRTHTHKLHACTKPHNLHACTKPTRKTSCNIVHVLFVCITRICTHCVFVTSILYVGNVLWCVGSRNACCISSGPSHTRYSTHNNLAQCCCSNASHWRKVAREAERQMPEPPVHLAFVPLPYVPFPASQVNLQFSKFRCTQPTRAEVSAHSLVTTHGIHLLRAREKLTTMAGTFHRRREGRGAGDAQVMFGGHAQRILHRKAPSLRVHRHMCEKQNNKGASDEAGKNEIGGHKRRKSLRNEGERGVLLGKLFDTMYQVWRSTTRDVDVTLILTDVAIVFAFFFARGAFDSAVAEGPQRCVLLQRQSNSIGACSLILWHEFRTITCTI